MRRFPIPRPGYYRHNEIPLPARRKYAGGELHDTQRNKARRDLGYFIPKPNGRPEEDVSMPDGIMVASACLPCGAIAGPETSNNSLSIAPPRTRWRRVGCTDDFLPGVAGLASAPFCRLPSDLGADGLLMDIVGCLPLQRCIIVDDLGESNASARYSAPYRARATNHTARKALSADFRGIRCEEERFEIILIAMSERRESKRNKEIIEDFPE